MIENPEIKLLQGFCTLPFGTNIDGALRLFGEPEEKQELKDEILGNSSLVYHYWDQGFSLFFDANQSNIFSSVELDNADTLLFGVKIFTLQEKQLIELLKKNDFMATDTEVHTWGEKRVSFDKAGLDCYFKNNKLVSVNFGVLQSGGDFIYFPN
jgi:hypothetical protein